MLGTYHTEHLLNALQDIHHIYEKPHLYAFFLNRCCDVLKAQGGTLFSVNVMTGEMVPEASRGVSLELLREMPFKMKNGLSGWAATHRKSVLIDNAQTDDRFNRAVDVITGIRTRSILCVPILRQDKILGVVELVNRVDGMFREQDMLFVQYFGIQVALALENSDLFQETQDLLAYTNSIINSLSSGFMSTNTAGVVTRCNMSACRILGIVPDDVLGKPLLKSLSHYPALGAILDVTQRNEKTSVRQEIQLQRLDGSPLIIGYSTFLIRDDKNMALGAGLIFQDLTHLRRS